ncbi:hypothetical protein OS188_13225 [Xanthomarina sp. F1114]|uniref:hypothetical protein n=1 Tax=Xanthomarina sp. F1114 TaxID=2996019 RepID=UPI00225E6829|nr:hypothetical protein [Xanthomarina sp. F1114]MCX7548913.1 hypothetical protein [Xanthomarina sp. F1114]
MQKITFLLLFIFTCSVSAQDLIITTNDDEISAKVEEIHIETISYKKTDNLSGPSYHIKKSEVSKIVFENGNEEVFDTKMEEEDDSQVSMEETEAFLAEYIGKYCYDHNGYLRNSYKAKFEGDYLRLTMYNKKKTKEISSYLYDFKGVYSFKRPDVRGGDLAYLNIHVPVLTNEKKDKWDRQKLVISVEGHDKAESIMNALKHYNYLLKNKNKKPGQKF